jgi:putative FmdB family regulatory protein
MPIYEYRCADCGHRFERRQKIDDPPIDQCPECDSAGVERLISAPAFTFKGGRPSKKREHKGRPVHQTDSGYFIQDDLEGGILD